MKSVVTCPKDGSKLQVKDTRTLHRFGFETVQRRRTCPCCDYRMLTVEISLELAEIAEIGDLLDELFG
mgnify:CR=1 FL=1